MSKADFDGDVWRKAIAMLSRLGGRAVAQAMSTPGPDRVEHAVGGSVGAQELIRSAEVDQEEIAAATKPIIGLTDDQVAAALRLAAQK